MHPEVILLVERTSNKTIDQLQRTTAQRHSQCSSCFRVLLVGSPCYAVNDPKKEDYLCISCSIRPWIERLSQRKRPVSIKGIYYAANRQLILVVFSTGVQTLARLFVTTTAYSSIITLRVNGCTKRWLDIDVPLETGRVNQIKLVWPEGEKELSISL